MIQAMVFDLDGTLVQTEKLKALSYAKAAAGLRPELDEQIVFEAFKEVVGRSRHEVAQHLVDRFELARTARAQMDRFGVETPWQAYVQIRLELYSRMLEDDRIILENQWPHNMALLEHARRSCHKLGLATMSYCKQVRRVLEVLGQQETFDFVATREDVENGKPDPEIYLLVSRELGVSPSECLVIEDSPSGVRAAINAGMRCIAVSTPFTRSGLHSDEMIDPQWIVDDPEELLDTVDRLIIEEKEMMS